MSGSPPDYTILSIAFCLLGVAMPLRMDRWCGECDQVLEEACRALGALYTRELALETNG